VEQTFCNLKIVFANLFGDPRKHSKYDEFRSAKKDGMCMMLQACWLLGGRRVLLFRGFFFCGGLSVQVYFPFGFQNEHEKIRQKSTLPTSQRNLVLEGKHHSGLDDSRNLAKIVRYIVENYGEHVVVPTTQFGEHKLERIYF
jgi:hypothetical protein